MPQEFAGMLRRLRQDRDISQRELASAAGLHHTYISKLENGQEKPSRRATLKLAAVLEADASEFQLAAGHMPVEFVQVLRENNDLQRLLRLASEHRLSEGAYSKLRDILREEDRVNVPVWLDD